MRTHFLAMIMALCWGGCASLPQTHEAVLEATGKPYLVFTARPSVCLTPTCVVTLKAEIRGDIHWCPTLLRWNFGDGAHDSPVTSCGERIWSEVRTYKTGEWSPSVQIFSGDQAVSNPTVAGVTVGVPAPPQ